MKRISTIFVVLILFCGRAFSLPLSRTCYTLPADMIDLYFGEEFISDDELHRRDVFALNVGLTDSTTLGVTGYILNYEALGGEKESGDIIFDLWHYTGRYLHEKLDTGFAVNLRLPTGPDVSTDDKWKNLSVGMSELGIGPVLSLRITDTDIFTMNLNYIFRQGEEDNFYGGLSINPTDADTYTSVAGLNPLSEDSFTSGERLSDDYISVAGSLMTVRIYPLVLFTEFYYAFTDFDRDDSASGGAVGYEPGELCLLSAGFKYVFMESLFIQVFGVVNPAPSDGCLKRAFGAGINIFF